MLPRVIAYHLVLTCYGFWLPNDPRGSWSRFVRAFDLYYAAGEATKVETHRSVAGVAHDHSDRRNAKRRLSRPAVRFTGEQARAVMRGIGEYVTANERRVYAAAVMPDHVHLVVARANLRIEPIAEQMKSRATQHLNREQLHPLAQFPKANGRLPSPWARHAWSVFLDSPQDVRRCIKYVHQNPTKAGFKPQHYEWITPFNA